MIIPVIFSLSPTFDNLMYSWVFYKGIDLAKHYGWPVFAQHQYFEEKEKQAELNVFNESFAENADYQVYDPSDEGRYIGVEFPEEVIREYISQFSSQTDAYLSSQVNGWPEMTRFLIDKVREIEKQLGESTEAFICLHSVPFIKEAAKELEIDVLQYEWGPFRKPVYRNTGYLDLKGSVCDGEMAERYGRFKEIAEKVPILSNREILALFLQPDYLEQAEYSEEEPEYEIGLALGYNLPHSFTGENQVTAIEMLSKVGCIFDKKQICVRYHPGDPVHAKLSGIHEDSSSLFQFIQRCRRICCISSNVSYEAMLYGKPAYEFGNSQYGLFANRDIFQMNDYVSDDIFLSFIAFGYLIPFEFLKDVQYLRWRLSRPSEEEIYQFHLNYYLKSLDIDESILQESSDQRLKKILSFRNNGENVIKYQIKDRSIYSATIYRDEGNGFNEQQAWSVPLNKDGTLNIIMRISSAVKALRFDPVEWTSCIVQSFSVTNVCDGKPYETTMIDAYSCDGKEVFYSDDPQIFIHLPEEHGELQIQLQADVVPISVMEGNYIREILFKKDREKEMVCAQMRDLRERKEQLLLAYNTITSSFFWRISEKPRKLLDAIKKRYLN